MNTHIVEGAGLNAPATKGIGWKAPGMNAPAVERIASALLYEGYMLYPYRRSAVKNRQRFNFGVIFPEPYSRAQQGTELCEMRTECLVQGGAGTMIDASVRFLHLFTQTPMPPGEPAWHEAIERNVTIPWTTVGDLLCAPRRLPFVCGGGEQPGRQIEVEGRIDLMAERASDGVVRVRVDIANLTALDQADVASRDEAMLRSLVSAHTILRVAGGEFVSLIDPPESLKAAAAACRNVGTWPVLAGDDGARDTMLSSPIIVYDFPTIADQSPGDFFDGTEMDEMLSLRILTMTDEEKREMAASDERARRLLERTEACSEEELMRMHGVLRQIRAFEEAP